MYFVEDFAICNLFLSIFIKLLKNILYTFSIIIENLHSIRLLQNVWTQLMGLNQTFSLYVNHCIFIDFRNKHDLNKNKHTHLFSIKYTYNIHQATTINYFIICFYNHQLNDNFQNSQKTPCHLVYRSPTTKFTI